MWPLASNTTSIGQLNVAEPPPTRWPSRRKGPEPSGPNSSRRLFRVLATQMLPLCGLYPTPCAQLKDADVSAVPLSPHLIGFDPSRSNRCILWLTVSVTNTDDGLTAIPCGSLRPPAGG